MKRKTVRERAEQHMEKRWMRVWLSEDDRRTLTLQHALRDAFEAGYRAAKREKGK